MIINVVQKNYFRLRIWFANLRANQFQPAKWLIEYLESKRWFMGPKKLKTADLDDLKPVSGASIRIPEFYQDSTVSINRTIGGGPILRTSIKAVL